MLIVKAMEVRMECVYHNNLNVSPHFKNIYFHIFSTISNSIYSLCSLVGQRLNVREKRDFSVQRNENYVLLCVIIFLQKNYEVFFLLERTFYSAFLFSEFLSLTNCEVTLFQLEILYQSR